jgi:predicted acyltransferase
MQEAKTIRERVAALDLLRGLTVAGMLVVDSPGSWSVSYAPLEHAAWNGWTPTDMIFPAFLFCVGMAWAFSFPRRAADSGSIWIKASKRTALLILIGLILNALPRFDLVHLRLPGILQRIAICFFLTVAITLATARNKEGKLYLSTGAIVAATVLLLVGYWAMLRFIPVPGFGAGNLDSLRSLPAWVDRNLFTTNHMWDQGTTPGFGVTYDPEGLVSTLGALASTLIGVLAAIAFRGFPERRRVFYFALAGAALVAAGSLLNPVLPFNKRLWTSSFVLLSSGVSLLALSILLLLPAAGRGGVLLRPLHVLGANAILAFILCQLLEIFSALKIVPTANGTVSPQHWGYATALAAIGDPYLASLACALGIMVIIVAAIWPLHRRGIFLRV